MPEGAPPIPAIKPNPEAKALVPVGPVKTIKEAAYKPKVFGEDVNTGKPVEVEFLDENDPKGKFPKAPRENKQPPRESPRPQSEKQKSPEPKPEAPRVKKEKPRTRAQRVIDRHEPVRKSNARTVLTELAAKPTPPPEPNTTAQTIEPPTSTPAESPKSAEPTPPPTQTQAPAPPPPEANKPPAPETSSERMKTDAIFAEASQLLFELKDARVALTALARQAADTPLGNEFRNHVIGMLQEIDTSTLPAHQRQAFDALKKKLIDIRPLPQPETKPQDTELYKFLKTQPASEQTAALMQALEHGAPIENVVSAALRRPEFKTVATQLAKTLFPDGVPQTTQDILKAAGIDETRANIRTMEGILHPKDKLTLKKLGTYLFIIFMATMLSSQILTPMMAEAEGQPSGR